MIKVLVVDDESDIRELLVDELKDCGYDTIEAADGAAALNRVHNDHPDIMLLDMMMPVLNGMQVLQVLRSNLDTANLPVVLVTATPADQGEQTAKDLGVNHYVTKPWVPGTIQTVIRVSLREAEQAEQMNAEAEMGTGSVDDQSTNGEDEDAESTVSTTDDDQPTNGKDEDAESTVSTTDDDQPTNGEDEDAESTVSTTDDDQPTRSADELGGSSNKADYAVKSTEATRTVDQPANGAEEAGEKTTTVKRTGAKTTTFDWGEEPETPIAEVVEKTKGSAFISTGYPLLDVKLGGGVPREGLTYIEGAASTGKSVLAQHFAFTGLTQGYKVAYFCSQHNPSGLVSQMASLGMNTSVPYSNGQFSISAIPNVDPSGDTAAALLELAERVKQKANNVQFVIIDDLTGIISIEQGSAVIGFLDQCKVLGSSGVSIVVAAHPEAMKDDILIRARSLSDSFLGLSVEKTGTRINNVLEVFKVRHAESVTGNRVNFEIEPGMGIHVNAISKANA